MFIKISVAVALLRIAATRPPFKWALWALIGATMIAALVFCVGIANICKYHNTQCAGITADIQSGHPINTLWGESEGTCNLELNTNVSLFFSAIEILTDFSLSILPAILLWNVQMVSLRRIFVLYHVSQYKSAVLQILHKYLFSMLREITLT